MSQRRFPSELGEIAGLSSELLVIQAPSTCSLLISLTFQLATSQSACATMMQFRMVAQQWSIRWNQPVDLFLRQWLNLGKLASTSFCENILYPPQYFYLRHEEVLYPLKALWVASHQEAVTAASFNTWQAQSGLKRLNFTDAVNLEGDEADDIVPDKVHHLRSKSPAVIARELEAEALDVIREGDRIVREISFIKRNAAIVTKAKKLKGYVCEACDLDFGEVYGAIGKCFIEAHHIEPLAGRGGISKKPTVDDFAMLCSNCHRMVHRGESVLSVAQLRAILRKAREGSNQKYHRQRSAY